MFTSRAGLLKNRKHKAYVVPYALAFCIIQLGLIVALNANQRQQGIFYHYQNLSFKYDALENSSKRVMINIIQKDGHISASQYINDNPVQYWDTNGDLQWDGATVYSLINLRSDEIDWVAVHYILKKPYIEKPDLPIFDVRLAHNINRRVKMLPHGYVKDAKAIYRYAYNTTSEELVVTKISIPVNE